MYRVEVGVLLLGRNGTMGLSRTFRLPFAPFPGMDLDGLTIEPDRCETITSVSWDVSRGCFYVQLMDRSDMEQTLPELIESYGPGWQLLEPGTDPVEDP